MHQSDLSLLNWTFWHYNGFSKGKMSTMMDHMFLNDCTGKLVWTIEILNSLSKILVFQTHRHCRWDQGFQESVDTIDSYIEFVGANYLDHLTNGVIPNTNKYTAIQLTQWFMLWPVWPQVWSPVLTRDGIWSVGQTCEFYVGSLFSSNSKTTNALIFANERDLRKLLWFVFQLL